MRKILFRGKREEDGEWVYGSFIPDAIEVRGSKIEMPGFIRNYDFEHESGCKVLMHEVERKTVGQFTGLLDKNGKRIFEGDICRNTRTGEVVFVAWHGTMAGYVWNNRHRDGGLCDFGELFRAYDKFEVIGNVHDNPELLKGE